jgi:hypothetical protein
MPSRQLSHKSLAANRANTQKSTGPRSARGKQHSSLNSLKHKNCCQARQSVSDCIEEATSVFAMQLNALWTMRVKLEIKFDQIAATSNAQPTDLREITELLIRTMNAADKTEASLETLARLAHFIE